MKNALQEYWNTVYSANPEDQLGWYEAVPHISLDLIDHCSLAKNDPILDVGSGNAFLVDHLINQNYTNLLALDISDVALEKMRSRLGKENACHVHILVDDITTPVAVLNLKDIVELQARHYALQIQRRCSKQFQLASHAVG